MRPHIPELEGFLKAVEQNQCSVSGDDGGGISSGGMDQGLGMLDLADGSSPFSSTGSNSRNAGHMNSGGNSSFLADSSRSAIASGHPCNAINMNVYQSQSQIQGEVV